MPRRDSLLGTYAALIGVLLASALVSLGRVETKPAHPTAARVAAPAAPVVPPKAATKPPVTETAKHHPPVAGLVAPVETEGAPRLIRGGSAPRAASAPSGSPQQRARQVTGQPATFHWALIIGINDYAPPTKDNVGSYQDAKALRAHLLSLGWRDDHIMLIANRAATRSRILSGLSWLASKTTPASTAVFHYSGHEKPFSSDVDGDGEARDVAIWAADNKLLVDGDLGDAMGRISAGRMWIDFAVCRAGGFNDAGMLKSGRVITYSSPESELSYEDPELHYSVFGYHSIVQGMREKRADANGDGTVSVEEAFAYAKPLVVDHTSGRQHPTMADSYSGSFTLRPPPPPAPPSGGSGNPQPSPSPTPCTLPVGCPATAPKKD
jgi:caspase domain-containing protein